MSHTTGEALLQPALPFPSLREEPPARHLVGGQAKVGRAVLQAQALLDGGTELRKGCAPKPSPSDPSLGV